MLTEKLFVFILTICFVLMVHPCYLYIITIVDRVVQLALLGAQYTNKIHC